MNYKIIVRDSKNLPVVNTPVNIKTKGVTDKTQTLNTDVYGCIAGSFKVAQKGSNVRVLFEGIVDITVNNKDYCPLGRTERITKETHEINDTTVINLFLNNDKQIIHKIKLIVIDQKGNPVKDADVKLEFPAANYNTLSTDTFGVIERVHVFTDKKYFCDEQLKRNKKSDVYYSISKEGYFSKKSNFSVTMNDSKTQVITLSKPEDYFNEEFLTSKKNKIIAGSTFNFLNLILLEGLFRDCTLDYFSINLENFKSKNYLSMEFTHTMVFNSLKMNTYDIAKILFDEVVRKVLNPLNDNLSRSKDIFGYGVTIESSSKIFSDELARPKRLVYRFYLPKKEVENYKNSDITGQQLLDKSIILLNDERIDLKLQ